MILTSYVNMFIAFLRSSYLRSLFFTGCAFVILAFCAVLVKNLLRRF